MTNWITGLNAVGSLLRTLSVIRATKNVSHKEKTDKEFSKILEMQLAERNEMAQRIMKQCDVNQDHKLSVEEIGIKKETFQRWDTNRDGYITLPELQGLLLVEQVLPKE